MFEYNSTRAQYIQIWMISKINEVKDYFVAEVKQRELMSRRLNKYIASFDYSSFDYTVLSVTSLGISTVIGAPVGIVSASSSLTFSVCTGIAQKSIKSNKK